MMRTRITRLLIVALVIAAGYIGWRDTTSVRLLAVEIPVAALSRDVTVLHVSDLHGARFGTGQADIARLLEGRSFDAIVLNGDHIPSFEADPAPALELLAVARRHAPVVFVTRGNHDTIGVIEDLVAQGATSLPTAGTAVRFATDAGTVVAAPAIDATGVPDDAAVVLAVGHYPMTGEAMLGQHLPDAAARVFLFGHAHGGQIRLPLIGALWAPAPLTLEGFATSRHAGDAFFPELRGRTLAGLTSADGVHVHTSAGLGTHAVGLRFLCPAEMTVITLRAAD